MVDDTGIHLLALAPKTNSPEVMFDAEFQWQANLPFNVPPASKSLGRVRGELKLLVQLDSQTLDMPIKENGPAVRKKIAGYDVQIGKLVAKGDGGYQLSFDLSRGTLSDETWQWFRHPMGRVRLLDDAGRDLKVSDASSGGDEKTAQCGVGFHTSDGTTTEKSGPPARLVWEFPTKMREVSVPFEFVELPLPVAGN